MESPLVSFVIATHNRGGVLVDCLRRTLANGLPLARFEVLVVDNASSDGTAALLAGALPQVTVLPLQKNAGPVAKNIAIARARGAFVVLLDDDAYPLPGAIAAMLRHFSDEPRLAAAVFDVTLPDGSHEASAYPDVFIGAGTGLRMAALRAVGDPGRALPAEFFMQAEEYDLSYRLIQAGFTLRCFADMPLIHLKTPGARVGARITRLDIRNNLYLLAKYVPEPLCHQLAADWLDRYFRMAIRRDRESPACADSHAVPQQPQSHKRAYLAGAAEGLARWAARCDQGRHLLSAAAVETIFKPALIRERLAGAARTHSARRLLFADYGKNLFPYFHAAKALGLPVTAVVDDHLAGVGSGNYRGIPLCTWAEARDAGYMAGADPPLVVISNLSPVHAERRAAALRRVLPLPVVDLFARPATSAAIHDARFTPESGPPLTPLPS